MQPADPSLTTGVHGLDGMLKGILPGDNIVWQVDTIDDLADARERLLAAERALLVVATYATVGDLAVWLCGLQELIMMTLDAPDFVHELLDVIETWNRQWVALALEDGVDYALVTGTHENTRHVENRLYHENRLLETFTWERLPESYHGSGCTLASAIAALLDHLRGLLLVQTGLEADLLNQPEVDWRTGEFYPVINTSEMWDFGGYNFDLYNTEIARRASLLVQSVAKAEAFLAEEENVLQDEADATPEIP